MKKNIKNAMFLIGLVLIVGTAIYFAKNLVISGDKIAEPIYPTGEQLLLSKTSGYLICRETGLSVLDTSEPFNRCTESTCGGDYLNQPWYDRDSESYLVYYIEAFCSSGQSNDCKIIIKSSGCKNSVYKQQIKIDGVWKDFSTLTYEDEINVGSSQEYKIRCFHAVSPSTPTIGDNDYLKSLPFADIYMKERGIYLEGSQDCEQGLLEGSLPDCSWVSTNEISVWKAMQEKGYGLPSDTELSESLRLGRTKPITCGWQVKPLFGNKNPMGKYSNKDVMCVPSSSSSGGASIYELIPVETEGGRTYYKQGNILGSGVNFCCSAGIPCSGDSVCENYKCTLTPQTCKTGDGQCSYADSNYFKYETTKTGIRQYIEYRCESQDSIYCWNKYVIKDNLPCFPGECSAGQYCDETKGCVDLDERKDCPVGDCCDEGNIKYKVQLCPTPKDCCYNAPGYNEPLHGICKDECNVCEQKEICDDNIDNDCDGKIDLLDSECLICKYKDGVSVVSKAGISQSSKECCELNGGYVVVSESKPPVWMFWKNTTTTTQCYKKELSFVALIIGILGIIAVAFTKWNKSLSYIGIPMVIISLIWLIWGLAIGFVI